jgi:hypothetical protein
MATSITKPRVGEIVMFGVNEVAWTGGSNITANQLSEPKGINAYRPMTDFRSLRATMEACQKPLEESKRLDTADAKTNKITFISWMNCIKANVETRGMDTVFRVMDSTLTTETYMLNQWGEMTRDSVATWVASLEAGLGTATVPCAYDRANLTNSGEMIKNSISIDMWSQIEREIPHDATGPEVLMAIIMAHQITSASIIQAMLEEIKGMKLNQQPAEDVVEFSKTLSELAERIEGSGPAPKNLAQVIAATYLSCEVLDFRIKASQLHDEANNISTKITWQEIVQANKDKYRSLKAQALWPPASAHKESEIQALQATVRKLEQQVGEGNRNGASGTNYHKDKTCFNCNEKGHISPNCPKKGSDGGNAGGNERQPSEGDDANKSAVRTAPKEGEPETKTVDGEEMKWCGKCRRWTKGDKKHNTAEHKRRSELETRAAGGLAAAEETEAEEQEELEEEDDDVPGEEEVDFLQMSSSLFYGATEGTAVIDQGWEELEAPDEGGEDFLPMASMFYAAAAEEEENRERQPDDDEASSNYRWCVHHRDWCLRSNLPECNAQSKGCAGRRQERQR